MPIPFPTNDTCDIYRFGHSPPSAPDVPGVAVHVIGRFRNIKANFLPQLAYDHILLMPLGTDVRDAWDGVNANNGDVLYLPNKNSGFTLQVNFVYRTRTAGLGYY